MTQPDQHSQARRPRRDGHRAPPPPPPPVPPPGPDHVVFGPPHELTDGEPERRFELEGREWVARVSGKGAAGTGRAGLAMVLTIHFADAAAPATPRFESLIAGRPLDALFDSELRELLRSARQIVRRDDAAPPNDSGAGRSSR